MKKHSNSLKWSEGESKRMKLGAAVEQKPREVMDGVGRKTGAAVGCGDYSGGRRKKRRARCSAS